MLAWRQGTSLLALTLIAVIENLVRLKTVAGGLEPMVRIYFGAEVEASILG